MYNIYKKIVGDGKSMEKIMKNIPLKKFFNIMMLLLILPSVIMLILLFSYSYSKEKTYTQENIIRAQRDISDSFASSLDRIGNTVTRASYDYNFLSFGNSSNIQVLENRITNFLASHKYNLLSNHEVIAVFLYNSKCDYFYPIYKYYTMSNLGEAMFVICTELTENKEESVVFTRTIQEHTYVIRAEVRRYGTLVVLLDPCRNAKLNSYNNIVPETGSYSFTESIPPDAKLLVPGEKVNDLDLYIRYTGQISQPFNTVQIVMLIIIMFLVIMNTGIFFSVTQYILNPLLRISRSIDSILEGNTDNRITSIRVFQDIAKIGNGINNMLDSIQQHEAETYSSRLDAVQAKLQFLQLQIRPHFYLNCLKNLNSLILLDKKGEAQTLLIALSDYIAHTFRDIKNYISIREELAMVQSYVNLCNMLTHHVHLNLALSGRCANVQCLPMIILMFVENSIKHTNVKEQLNISISVELLDHTSDSQEMLITIRDDGGGYPDNVLRDFTQTDPSRMSYRTTQIGMSNVLYRLWLVYREEAAVTIRNENSCAIAEILIPAETLPAREEL